MNKRNYFNVGDTAKAAVLFVILQGAFLAILSGAVYAGFRYSFETSLVLTALLEATFALTVVIICSIHKINIVSATKLNQKPSVKQILVAIVICFVALYGFSAITNAFYYFLRNIGFNSVVSDLSVSSGAGLLLEIVCVGLVPAVCEELLFRGLFLNGLSELGKWPAILLSAMMFMLMHGNPDQTIYQFVLGVVLGYAFYSTGSIWVPMTIHCANNTYITLLNYFVSGSSAEGAEVVQTMPWNELASVFATGIIIAGIAAFLIYILCAYVKNNKFEQNKNQQPCDSVAFVDGQKVEMSLNENTIPNKKQQKTKYPKYVYFFYFLSIAYLVFDWVQVLVMGIGG